MQFTLIDADGKRIPFRGLEGQSIVEVLEGDEQDPDLSEDYICQRCLTVPVHLNYVAARIMTQACALLAVMQHGGLLLLRGYMSQK